MPGIKNIIIRRNISVKIGDTVPKNGPVSYTHLNDVKEWPFEPDTTGYGQSFAEIPGNPFGGNYEAGMFARRELTFQFSVREDVMTGYYPLKFQVWYTLSLIHI